MPAHRIIVVTLVVALGGCQKSEQPQNAASVEEPPAAEVQVSDAARQKAVAAKDALFARLSTRLVDVMGKDGAAAAIDVCSREAATIAAEVGKEHDVRIGRTSFQLRNPNNSPPDWAQPFVERRTVEPVFVALPNDRSGALLPIKLKKKCLTCHGPADTIAPDVQSRLAEFYPNDNATGFSEGDLRGWFWVEVPAATHATADEGTVATEDHSSHAGGGPGMGRGRGMMGRGHGGGMREDMTTLHAMFADRDKIKRTVKNLPNGAEATTESDDEEIAGLIQEHVPAMEGRVMENNPLPPMTFHPIFVELIKHSDDYTLTYVETEKGMKVRYESDNPYVVMLVQEHAKLVSRFIKNGMEEIHKPYTLPILEG